MSPRWPLPIGAIRSMISRCRRAGGCLQAEPLLRVQRRQFREVGALRGLLSIEAVDRVELGQHRVPLACFARPGWPDGAGDLIAPAQPVLPDLGEGQVDVGRPALIASAADKRLAVGDVEEARNRDRHGVLGRHCIPGRRGIRSRKLVAGQRALRIVGNCGH